MLRQHSRAFAPAHVEAIESRRLLSASVPLLTGSSFTGTATNNNGDQPSELQLTFATETKRGALTGTLLVDVGGSNEKTFSFRGSANHAGNFIIHATTTGQKAVLNGHADATVTTLLGHFVAIKPHHPANTGSFSLAR